MVRSGYNERISMEPLAHTLVGACLGETGLKHRTPLAAATLLVAANLPDVDGACYAVDADLAFGLRRGLTHGVLAMAVLPAALVGLVVLYDRYWRRRRRPELPAVKAGWLLALAYLGLLTHPFLDWLNTYGVRLLMPFSRRWFYGDAVFIVDPWLWLLAGGAVMLAWTRSRSGVAAWSLVGAATSLVVLTNSLVPLAARAIWMGWVAALIAARLARRAREAPRFAVISLALTAAYIMMMIGGSRVAEWQVRTLGTRRGWTMTTVAAMPVPVNPVARQVIVVTPDRYLFVPVNWMTGPDPTRPPASLPRGEPDRVVQAALEAPGVQGVRGWLRFPSYEVRALRTGGYRVFIRDARFAIGSRPGFGVVATVELDDQLRPMSR